MWTSSFVLVAGGYSLALLAFCYWAIEQQGWRKGWTWIWIVFGSNAIVAYMFSELVPSLPFTLAVRESPGRHVDLTYFVFETVFARIPDPHWAAFAYSVSYTAVCFIPVWVLYRKKIFLKV
jgi:predicted acyltransferase